MPDQRIYESTRTRLRGSRAIGDWASHGAATARRQWRRGRLPPRYRLSHSDEYRTSPGGCRPFASSNRVARCPRTPASIAFSTRRMIAAHTSYPTARWPARIELRSRPIDRSPPGTWDQGPEMRDWKQVAVAADIEIFLCDPHAPWQRATNGNNVACSLPRGGVQIWGSELRSESWTVMSARSASRWPNVSWNCCARGAVYHSRAAPEIQGCAG
jgi:hypothetical protein